MKSYIVLLVIFSNLILFAQTEEEIFDISLDEILNTEYIEAITKQQEELKTAPVSVSVLYQEEIISAGVTTIPEALRLLPGIIVREQSPGNFDVYVRGFDNCNLNSTLPFPTNSITLIMIDYRVVYNYFSGGTFWETLPISIEDIEKIELIRGPYAALYGPNAISGVINIKTRKKKSTKPESKLSLQSNGADDFLANGSIGFSFLGVNSLISSNYSERKRQDKLYYNWNYKDYMPLDQITTTLRPDAAITNLDELYPQSDQSMKNFAVNCFLYKEINDHSNTTLNFGIQTSESQKIYINNFSTPFSNNLSQTFYADFKYSISQFSAHLSYMGGNQETSGMPDWKYGLDIVDGNFEYLLNYDKLSFRPGANFRIARYDGGFIDGEQSIKNFALVTLADYHFSQKLRALGAVRLDKYNFPEDVYFSYQGSLSYTLTSNHILRTSFGHSNKFPFMLDTFIKNEIELDFATIQYLGNKNIDLLSADTYELGYRYKINKNIIFDIENFITYMNNFSNLIFNSYSQQNNTMVIEYKYQNIEYEAQQFGTTLVLSFSNINRLYLDLFATLQKSEFDPKNNSLRNLNPSLELETTPMVYAGFTLNIPYKNLNVNLSSYYTSKQKFPGIGNSIDLKENLTVNSTVAYNFFNHYKVFINFRNLLNSNVREYGFADKIQRSVFFGISYR